MPRPDPTPEQLMAYLDGEMSAEEARDFEAFLDQHPEWREEVAEMASLVEGMDNMRVRPPSPETWDHYWEEIDSRLAKPIGWIIMAFGGALLAGVGTWKILIFATNPWIRVGLAMLIAGFLIVLLSVVRGFLIERPKDRYRNIRK